MQCLNFSDLFRPSLRVGVLGCMAERLKKQLLDVADVVAGPDAYRYKYNGI